jgi:hypothetical protein
MRKVLAIIIRSHCISYMIIWIFHILCFVATNHYVRQSDDNNTMLFVLKASYFILAVLAPTVFSLDPDASVTIDQYPGYDHQRACGKGCIQNNYDPGDDLENELGCTWNACYCGAQYQSTATQIIRSCWTAYCGTSQSSLLSYDISTALSLYDAYCGDGAAETTTILETDARTTIIGTTAQPTAGSQGSVIVYVTHLTIVTDVETASASPTYTAGILGSNSPRLSAISGLALLVIACAILRAIIT